MAPSDTHQWLENKPPGARELTTSEKLLGPYEDRSKFVRGALSVLETMFVKPAVFFHDKIVAPFRAEEYYWYHRRYRRVPTIDECYMHDMICRYEANVQYKRDKMVEEKIVALLRRRAKDCIFYEDVSEDVTQPGSKCYDLYMDFERAGSNLYLKYGDMPYWAGAEECLMKQKHRLIWERRNGGHQKTEKGINLDG